MVVIPAMLSGTGEVDPLVEGSWSSTCTYAAWTRGLFLCPGDRLYRLPPRKTRPGDTDLVEIGAARIHAMNEKYPRVGSGRCTEGRFALLTDRQWNPSEGVWIGFGSASVASFTS